MKKSESFSQFNLEHTNIDAFLNETQSKFDSLISKYFPCVDSYDKIPKPEMHKSTSHKIIKKIRITKRVPKLHLQNLQNLQKNAKTLNIELPTIPKITKEVLLSNESHAILPSIQEQNGTIESNDPFTYQSECLSQRKRTHHSPSPIQNTNHITNLCNDTLYSSHKNMMMIKLDQERKIIPQFKRKRKKIMNRNDIKLNMDNDLYVPVKHKIIKYLNVNKKNVIGMSNAIDKMNDKVSYINAANMIKKLKIDSFDHEVFNFKLGRLEHKRKVYNHEEKQEQYFRNAHDLISKIKATQYDCDQLYKQHSIKK